MARDSVRPSIFTAVNAAQNHRQVIIGAIRLLLKIVLNHFEIKKSEKELKKLLKCSTAGVELEDLLRIAKKIGLNGFVKENSNIKEIKKILKKKTYSIIVGWFSEDDGHYSVVSHIDKENVYLQDPEIGNKRKIEREDFMKVWFDFKGKYIKPDELIIRQIIAISQ